MSEPARPRNPWRLSILVFLGVIGFYYYLARPAEPVNDMALAGSTAYLALGRAGVAIVDSSNPELPNQIGNYDTTGGAFGIAVDGQYAYVADGRDGLRILDISSPWAPFEVGFYDTPGTALDVAISGDFAYVADDRNGLLVVNVADRANPGMAGSYQPEARIRRVIIRGEYTYLGDDRGFLYVVRIANPRRPEEISVVDIQNRIENLEVTGERLYLAAGERGLVIIDVSEPARPAELQAVALTGPVRDVSVVGDIFAYLAVGRDGLHVLDVNEPGAIVEVGSYERPLQANHVAVENGRVYLADEDVGLYVLDARVTMRLGTILSDDSQRGNALEVVADDRFAYIASAGQGLRVIDVRDPGDTYEAAFFDTGGEAVGVTLSGDFIYLADGEAGWRVLFLADRETARPEVQEIATRDTPGEVNQVAVQGQMAYVADGSSGLRIFSLVDPAAPVEVGTEDTPGDAFGLAVLGEYAYIADGVAGLRVINVLDPARPAEVGSFDTPGETRSVTVSLRLNPDLEGSGIIQPDREIPQVLAFLADGEGGLRVIDVTDPRNPVEVAFFDPYEFVQDLELRGETIYLTTRGSGLRVVDVSDLTQISEIGSIDTPGEASGLALAGPTAYVADLNRGLRIIDVRDPARPSEVGFFDVPRVVRKVQVAGDYAFLGDAERGFRIADVSQPQRMREIGHYDQGGLVEDFDVQGTLVYTAQATGLQIVDVSDPRNPVQVGAFATNGRASALDVVANLAFVTTGESGLTIADVSQPDAIQNLSVYDTPGNAQDVFVSDIYVYIADGEAGLEIVNVADPRDPKTASVIDQFQDARSVVVVDHYAFLADGPNGLWVIDVEKPVAPQTIAYLDTPGTALDLDSTGVYLFVADGEGGVQVIYILEPDKLTNVGTAELQGLSLNLDSEARTPQEGEVPGAGAPRGSSGGFLVFVAKGERGLEILEASESVETSLLGVYQTPGMAPLAQVSMDEYPLVSQPGVEKSARTVRHYMFDLVLVGGVGFLFWLAFFAQFVLPLQRLGDRWKAFNRLFLYFARMHGPAVRIENGTIVQHTGEAMRRGPGVVLLDTASAAVLRTKTAFKRVIGPGVVFTEMGEYLHQEAVDLHIKFHPSPPLGPDPGIDPFAPQRKSRVDGESDEAYQARQKRRMETSGLTRDGVEVVARILAVVKTETEPGQGGTQFGFNRRSVQLALTREGVVPLELRNMPWYEIPAYLAVDVWREYLSKFALSDLFETVGDSSTHGDDDNVEPPWLHRDETGIETVVRMVRQRMTRNEVDELDGSGRPTGRKQKSREYRILKEMGVRVNKVSVSGIRFPSAVESQLVHQWTSTWLQRAGKEREEIEKQRNRALQSGEEQALLDFAGSVSASLGEALVDQEGTPLPEDKLGHLDRRASLETLLVATRQWLLDHPEMSGLLASEGDELTRLLAWVRETRR